MHPAVSLRPTTAADTDFAREVHHRANRDVVERQFGAWDDAAQDQFFAADWDVDAYEIVLADGVPCGYVCVEDRAADVYVRNIHLLPEYQGRGIGSTVLREAIARADARRVPIRLQTLHANRAANLYRRLGFAETGRTGTHVLFERRPPSVDRHLRSVADRLAAAYLAHLAPRAILLTGSAATGGGDHFSDVDMVIYVESPPTEDQLQAVRDAVGAESPDGRKLWVDGVECDGGPMPIAECERLIADVLERFEAKSLGQKVLEGISQGVALHGGDLIARWQERASAYPPELARAMVEAYLTFWPIWRVDDWVAARDMTLWYQHTLVESSHNLLGVLAGLNRLYYSPAYFKRLHRFVDRMRHAPPDLADRLEALFASDPSAAILNLERLVGETVALLHAHMPEVDTSRVRRDLGARRPSRPR